MSFSKDFIWGAAAASYQIEGAAKEDGKGISVWDTYSHTKGKTKNNDHGDIACDHYHRYKEDIALMKEMGIKAYRLSISWPRILPEGVGSINESGLAFYNHLVDELLAAGIEPYITLFHWDLPQAIYDRGGWKNRDISDWFAQYVKVVVDSLSDRVTKWITVNEPQCHILLGHVDGSHAPGDQVSIRDAFIMMHNIHLAHGKAVQTIRKFAKKPGIVGYAPNPWPGIPFSNNKNDVEAAKNYSLSGTTRGLWSNTWWLDPVLSGRYPEDGLAYFKEDFPFDIIQGGDLEQICQPLDFLGINMYQGAIIQYDDQHGYIEVPRKTGYDKTAMKWLVLPEILYYMPKYLYERYQLPIYITENGLSLSDWVSLDGKVHDLNRIDFMHRYLKELKRATTEGVDIRGYFYWSVMDNFEWSEGYNERFGLIHVDYVTQKRTLKDSAYWYRKVIESNGDIL
ncbi:beta-glucosidase [Mobilitalea sibirica]|uniref:Beta-glucosidase n=1 Tax=Mobilitalea sibirica TaxID=1462919 RepID=A0A8J7KRK6_9FIRM|nr:GH1 family beta-glucosidase [Mobilitalea sibirica]MBH1939396.1 beta-glucosidase [Mobilitalea sibirica]